jgi:hypothetical protein
MRTTSMLLALVTACGTTSYQIPASELMRLSQLPPEQRGQNVRVVQQLSDADVGAPAPVNAETQIVIFPDVYVEGGDRRRGYGGGGNWGGGGGGGWGPHASAPNAAGGHGGGGVHVGGVGGGGGGGDGKAEAIAIIVIAVTALVIAAAVEGSRYDGYAQIHPMTPLYLFGRDGSRAVMPLAALDPQSAAFSRYAIIRSNETPWRWNGRADLDRQGLTYAVLGGIGTFQSADGSKASGTATTIQFGYFFDQHVGLVSSLFFGWRENNVAQTLFETRYTLEVDGYVAQAGPVHLGVYAGGGGATRLEDGIPGGNASSLALLGGAQVQLDINTRLALTARLGQTYGHGELMTDALFGLAVY